MKKFLKKNNSNLEEGFTLIELLVSITLFTIASVAMITALYTVNASWRKVQAMATVMDNLNFALENISRTIRTSDGIVCGGKFNTYDPNCDFFNTTGSAAIKMHSTLGGDKLIEYSWGYDNGFPGIQKSESTDNGATWSWPVSLTSQNLTISKLSFFVSGASLNDSAQPNVIIMVQGTAVAGKESTPFSVQTLVTQRNIE